MSTSSPIEPALGGDGSASSPGIQTASGRRRLRLRALGIVHLAMGVALGVMFLMRTPRPSTILLASYLAITIGQGVLLTLWAGWRAESPRTWLSVVVFGSLYLGLVVALPIAMDFRPVNVLAALGTVYPYALVACFLTISIAAGLVQVLRHKAAHLEVRPAWSATHASVRWSLAHLLAIIAVAGLMSALVRYARLVEPPPRILLSIPMVGVFWIAFTVYALSIAWAVLSRGNPAVRVLIACAVAVVLAATVVFAAATPAAAAVRGTLYLTSTQVVVLPSLLVVRSCGYRLVANVSNGGDM